MKKSAGLSGQAQDKKSYPNARNETFALTQSVSESTQRTNHLAKRAPKRLAREMFIASERESSTRPTGVAHLCDGANYKFAIRGVLSPQGEKKLPTG